MSYLLFVKWLKPAWIFKQFKPFKGFFIANITEPNIPGLTLGGLKLIQAHERAFLFLT